MNQLILSIFLLLASSQTRADYPLEIIDLDSRSAAEMVPIIKPFVEPGGTVTGLNYQLIIRTSPYNLEEIRELIARFDNPPKKLMIYVRQGSIANQNRRYNSIETDAMVGKRTRVIVGTPDSSGTIRYRVKDATTQSKQDTTHHLQTIEGHPAFIQTGKATPIQEYSSTNNGGKTQQKITTRYRNSTSGFYVTPRVNGQQVTLHISPNREREGRVSGTFDTSYADTTVTGRLGEWMSIGGVNQHQAQSTSGILKQRSTSSQENQSMQALVEEITN